MGSVEAVELRDIHRRCGETLANDGVNLRVRPGSIHALVGENGAGKSTAMKVLYGQFQPDSGQIFVDGKPRRWRSPADAIAAGLGMVHQHFLLAENHSALDNVLLGTHAYPFSPMGRAAARLRLGQLMERYGLTVPLDQPVGELPVGLQQRVEILKLLFRDSRVLILDEPTAVLAPAEAESLFQILRGLRAAGRSVILITHKLREVMAVADRVTVLRAGRVVGEQEVGETSAAELAKLMVGGDVPEAFVERKAPGAAVVLAAWNLKARGPSALAEASLEIREGEILGIAGVEGNGQSELLELLLNPRGRLEAGTLSFHGQDVSRCGRRQMRERGVALLPEDRLRDGLLLEWDLTQNFLLGRQRQPAYRWLGWFIHRRAARAAAARACAELGVRPARLETAAGRLSGGNQQKLVVARELSEQPRLLIAAQPTRGVDIGAIQLIHERILAARNAGAAVLLVSSELDEVLRLADRVQVFYRGRSALELSRENFDECAIGAAMTGLGRQA